MEKTEGNKKISPGKLGTRRYLFGSILNFSVSQGVRQPSTNSTTITTTTTGGGSPTSNPTNQTFPTTKKTTNHETCKLSRRKEKEDSLKPRRQDVPKDSIFSKTSPLRHTPNEYSTILSPRSRALREERSQNSLNASNSKQTPSPLQRVECEVNVYANDRIESPNNCGPIKKEFSPSSTSSGQHLRRNGITPHPKPRASAEKEIYSPSPTKTLITISKERTPEWIKNIFELAKHGRLDELKTSLIGLDTTLIRHLADANGNTLLHSAAKGGHLLTLQWLISILGPQTEAALSDQNRAGRTVILSTLKGGQLECFQWMVLHTSFGDKALVPTEGKWSLLHFASKYGNLGAVRWLCEQLVERQVRVDLRDVAGMTPLHVAAKSGRIGVSQELIRAGADPLCQTELGWKPSDLALRHHHMDCVNYFIMAEAAGSIGKELNSILTAFSTLHQQQETVRTHFREVLRVAKWLMKERSDLIKRFTPTASNPSVQEGAGGLLLGGTLNGVRLSELEHSLVLAEQGWKSLGDVSTSFPVVAGLEHDPPSSSNTDILQSRLFASQARQDKSVTSWSMMSGSSSEGESSLSTGTSGDEEESSTPLRRRSRVQRPKTKPIVSNSALRPSTNTPWLLEAGDSILSALSPTRNPSQQLPDAFDLLRVESGSNLLQHTRAGSHGRMSSSENSPITPRTTNVYINSDGGQSSNTVISSAAVLEVIEPLQVNSKGFGSQSLPMNKGILRRASLSQSQSSGLSFSSSGDAPLSLAVEMEGVKNRRRMKMLEKARSETQLSSHYSTCVQKEFEEAYPAPDLIRGTHHLGGGKTVVSAPNPSQPVEARLESLQTNSGLEDTYSDFEVRSHFASFHSGKSHSTDGSLAVGPKGGNFSSVHISSLPSPPPTSDPQFLSDIISSPSHLQREFLLGQETEPIANHGEEGAGSETTPYVSVSPSSTRKNYGASLTILPIGPSEFQVFPVRQLHHFHHHQDLTMTGETKLEAAEMIPTSATVHLPNDSSSSSNTPIMPNSHSSVSGGPLRKTNWMLPTEEEISKLGGGRPSPSPSEVSKTESTLAPPPSNASEASKTESAQGETAGDGETLLVCERREEERRTGSPEEVGVEEKVLQMRRDDKPDDSDKDKSSLRTNPVQATPCIIRQRLPNPSIHKTSIHHRVKKSSRGQAAKPWYEIEDGSDDEEILLRVARARSRSSCHSTPSLSAAEESGSEEMSCCDEVDGQECRMANCSRHNCPDFV